jgi:large subunit ribosomal protein L3
LAVGGSVTVNILDGVAAVDVTGITKGCGFQGTMKKHGFKGQRATHGVKKVHRHPGGTGAGTYPGNTIKGKKMAGRYGSDRVTMRNLKVVRVDADNHLLLVRGAVPGPAGAFVIIRETNKLG